MKLLAAGAFAGVIANVTGYLITGRFFHRYQASTPDTWRAAESWKHYSYAAVVRISASIGIGFLYAAVGAVSPVFGMEMVTRGATFGSILWMVTILPVVLEMALFVNWHRGFVVGLLLDWLVVCALASVSANVALSADVAPGTLGQ